MDKYMDKSLECSICQSDFTQPKQLPCFHSFCLECLIKYCEKEIDGDMKPCPLCRTEFCIPQGGVKELRSDLITERLLIENRFQNGTSIQQESKCELCVKAGDQIDAEHFCMECRQDLCGRCKVLHSSQSVSKSHKLVEMKDKPNELELLKMKSDNCVSHRGEQFKLFCCDCKSLICMICKATHHNDHICQDLSAAVKIKRQLANNDIDAVERCRTDSAERRKAVDKVRDDWESVISDNKNKIDGAHARWFEILNQHRERLITKVKDFGNVRKKEIEAKGDMDELRDRELDRFIAHSVRLMERGTDCEIIRVGDELHKRAEELIKSQDEYNKQVLTDRTVTFVPSPHPTDQQIQDLLGGFLYTGEWENKEFEISSVLEAQWMGKSEAAESTLSTLMKALELCKSADTRYEVEDVQEKIQNSIKILEVQRTGESLQKIELGAPLFEHLNSATEILYDKLNQKTEKNMDLAHRAANLRNKNIMLVVIVMICLAIFPQIILNRWNDSVALNNAEPTKDDHDQTNKRYEVPEKYSDMTEINNDPANEHVEVISDVDRTNNNNDLTHENSHLTESNRPTNKINDPKGNHIDPSDSNNNNLSEINNDIASNQSDDLIDVKSKLAENDIESNRSIITVVVVIVIVITIYMYIAVQKYRRRKAVKKFTDQMAKRLILRDKAR